MQPQSWRGRRRVGGAPASKVRPRYGGAVKGLRGVPPEGGYLTPLTATRATAHASHHSETPPRRGGLVEGPRYPGEVGDQRDGAKAVGGHRFAPGGVLHDRGHALLLVWQTKSGRRFYGTCSCGYMSTTRTSKALAQEALEHHCTLLVKKLAADGLLPVHPRGAEAEALWEASTPVPSRFSGAASAAARQVTDEELELERRQSGQGPPDRHTLPA